MKRTFTLQQIEKALDEARVFACMSNGNLWRTNRNGATKLWKTRPNEFRIPIKIGFREHGEITHKSTIGAFGEGTEFTIKGL